MIRKNILEAVHILENLTAIHDPAYCGKVYYCNDESYAMIEVPVASVNHAILLLGRAMRSLELNKGVI